MPMPHTTAIEYRLGLMVVDAAGGENGVIVLQVLRIFFYGDG